MKNWAIWFKFVKVSKNSSYYSVIQWYPYKAMSGCDVGMGLIKSSLPQDVHVALETEEEKVKEENGDECVL